MIQRFLLWLAERFFDCPDRPSCEVEIIDAACGVEKCLTHNRRICWRGGYFPP